MARIHDVAAYMIGHFDNGISTMKLQKLCYMAQGWSLALANRPLFADDFEAWRNGPVSRALYREHRGEYSRRDWPLGDGSQLTKTERVICDAVLANYGALSGLELSELTHQPGTPWSETRRAARASEGAASSATIPQSEIERHFRDTLLKQRS